MKASWGFAALLFAVTALALLFRLPKLDQRPMHGDEAVQALKFSVLYETGVGRYDPYDYHGPSLNYLTLLSMWLSPARDFADTTESTFRIVPVLFGVGLVLLLWLVADGLGRSATICAGVLTTISPAMVFYSRYYVMEMLLVFFTFAVIACAWRYVQSRKAGWALLVGASLGLMYATKETSIIAYASMLAAVILTVIWSRWRTGKAPSIRPFLKTRVLAGAVAVGLVISFLLLSAFLANLRGPLDSLGAYVTYFQRALGESLHVHPWYYYLKMLIWTKYCPGPTWSEGLIVVLSLVGIAAALTGRGMRESHIPLARFLAFYTVLMTVAYSAIPHKTPWNVLSFLHGMMLLAGVGAVVIVRSLPGVPGKVVASLVLAGFGCQLAWQAHLGSFKYCADHCNPYVYAHPVKDVLKLAENVESLAQVHPDGHDMLIKVFAPDSDYWPLPWYLRRFRQVGYWDEVPQEPDAPVVIAASDYQAELDARLRDSYHAHYAGLRPGVVLSVYVRTDLWKAFLARKAADAEL